jgi:hypothetical protein
LAGIARGRERLTVCITLPSSSFRTRCSAVGSDAASDTLDELVLQDRLRPLEVLPEVLALY